MTNTRRTKKPAEKALKKTLKSAPASACPIPNADSIAASMAQLGSWTFDPSTKKIWWSEQTYHIHELAVGTPIHLDSAIGFYPPEAQAMINAAFASLINTGKSYALELPFVTARGREIFVLSKGQKIQTEHGDLIFGTFQDVTESSQRKKTLEANTSFLETIIRNIPHMVFVKEAKDLRFIRFNHAGEKLLGVKNSDLLGKNDYDFFPKEQAEFFIQKDRDVLAGEEILDIPEEPLDTHLGRRYLHTLKIPIRDTDGTPQYLLGISQDITEIKEANALITAQQEALTHSAKLSALGEMAGGVAHEINNPLAIIQGLAGKLLILTEKQKITPDIVQATSERIVTVVDRISKIVRSLQNIARNGNNDPLVKVPLNKIMEDTLSLCRERFKSVGIELQIAEVDDKVVIPCRETQMTQVLLNLLNNAFDAIESQPVRWIRIEFEQTPNTFRILIIDSGPGVPNHIRDKIMQPFFTTKEVGKGTGLGLSISRALIEQQKGKLSLDTARTNTCFVVEIPTNIKNFPQVA